MNKKFSISAVFVLLIASSASLFAQDDMQNGLSGVSNQELIDQGTNIVNGSGALSTGSATGTRALPSNEELIEQGRALIPAAVSVQAIQQISITDAGAGGGNKASQTVNPSLLNPLKTLDTVASVSKNVVSPVSAQQAAPQFDKTATYDIPAFMMQKLPKKDVNSLFRAIDTPPQEKSEEKPKYTLAIMISFSMPDNVIKAYSKQAKEAGGVILMRGLYQNSLTKTVNKAVTVNPSMAGWQIDPVQFRRFKVDKVPTIVLIGDADAPTLTDGCAQPVSYAKVVGDVSVRQALEIMRLRANKPLAEKAGDLLKTIERSTPSASGGNKGIL